MKWEWLDDKRLLKTCDYSDFTNYEMRVPEEVEAFFSGNGDRLEFNFNDRAYPIYIKREASAMELIWSKVLVRKLAEALPDFKSRFEGDQSQIPGLLFVKNDDQIDLSLVEEGDHDHLEIEGQNSLDNKVSGPAGQGLSRKLKEWIDEYPNYYPRDFRFSFKEVIQTEIPEILATIPPISAGDYTIQGFAGDSEWAEIPWVSVSKKDTQESGLSLVYCLAKDSQILYLAILYQEEGAGVGSLAERVNAFRQAVANQTFKTRKNEIYLADPLLVSGFVYYQAYEEGLPGDAQLVSDYTQMIKLYEALINHKNKPIEAIEIDQKTDLSSPEDDVLDELNDDGQSDQGLTDQALSDAGLSIEMEEVVEQQEPEIDTSSETESPQIPEFQAEPYNEQAKLLDLNDDAHQNGVGNEAPIEKGDQEPELKAFAEEVESTLNFLEEKQKGIADNIQKSQADQLEHFVNLPLQEKAIKTLSMPNELKLLMDKMGSRGFYFPESFIVNYYLSLKAKPFLILQGRAGTGKTSFPRLFAEALGASYENGRFERILVAKSWEDEKMLFGSFDSRGSFVASPIVKIIRKAMDDPEMPHFLLLDEMDQAKDMDCYRLLLEGVNGRDEPLLEREDFASDNGAFREYGSLVFPENLYIIGTLKKQNKNISALLDSGNLIEMPEVAINAFPASGDVSRDSIWNNQHFKMNSPIATLPEIIENLMRYLTMVQSFLLAHQAGMGYRQKNEILAYGINSGIEGLFSEAECIDRALVQRLLPWIILQGLGSKRFYRELLLLSLEGDSFKDQMIKEELLSLSVNDFAYLIRQWESKNYFIWPETAHFLIKEIGN